MSNKEPEDIVEVVGEKTKEIETAGLNDYQIWKANHPNTRTLNELSAALDALVAKKDKIVRELAKSAESNIKIATDDSVTISDSTITEQSN